MSRRILAMSLAMCALALAAEGFKVLSSIKIGGTGGWDYVAVDANANRVYASHGTVVEVVDTVVARVLDHLGVKQGLVPRWSAEPE